jgi:HD-GYP domain-containing protein (c-di-GMP phosphodiesterase class II)
MSVSSHAIPQESIAAEEMADENPHYLRAVTDLGEKQEIVAHSDIYAANGMKLLAKGARINRQQFDRLIQHKLTKSVDLSVMLERSVDAAELARQAGMLLDQDSTMARLAARSGDMLEMKHWLGRVELPAPLPTRLTVMMHQRNELFRHSLRTAIIALALGRRLRLPAQDMSSLVLAALLHDVGELHTDPVLLDAGHQIAPSERRFVYVHPVTGYLLVQSAKNFPSQAAMAILQHHERLDGSGYPYGRSRAEISKLARILAVADVAEAVIDRFDTGRFEMLLRMQQTRFDKEVVNALRDLVAGSKLEAQACPGQAEPKDQLERFAKNLDAWFTLSELLGATAGKGRPKSPELSFLFERMTGIRRLVLQAGLDPADVSGMEALAKEDPQVLAELNDMLDELDWMLRDVANEIERRSPEVDVFSKTALGELVEQFRPEARQEPAE